MQLFGLNQKVKPSRQFVASVFLVIGILLFVWLLWQLVDVILLAFGAVLFAIGLRCLASPVERYTPVTSPWSVLIACLFTGSIAALFVYLLGAQVQEQVANLADEVPAAVASFGERFGIEDLYGRVREQIESYAGRSGVITRIIGYGSFVFNVITNMILIVVAGTYLAVKPAWYKSGILKLVPDSLTDESDRALTNLGHALRLWLLGQGISMLVVGTLTTIGLYLIGMPSAFALGLIAGIVSFVPIVGPIVSAIPAVLLAMSEQGNLVLWVVAVYLAVQLVESNLIMPIVQRKVVDLPPFMTLFGILAFGVLFGPLGVLFGTPITVALLVLTKQFYVQDTLHKPTAIPGET